MLKRFTKTDGNTTSFDVVSFEKEMKEDPVSLFNEIKEERRLDFESKYPKAEEIS